MRKPAVSSYVRDEIETMPAATCARCSGTSEGRDPPAGGHRPVLSGYAAPGGNHEDSIRSLHDLARLPSRPGRPPGSLSVGFMAAPMADVFGSTRSGTTGKPTVVAYTRRDIDLWSDLIARCYAACGVTDRDVVHNAYGYGLFTGGLGLHYGAERLGATVIPVSGGNTKRQLMIMRDFGSTVLCCTPSYSLLIAEGIQQAGVDPASLALRVGIFGAEPWSEPMRAEIESRLGITALNVYGLSEVMGPGVSCECTHKQGMHILEDHFIPEIIDPDTGDPLPDGETGELVFTCVTKEALPLLRYRTRDRTRLMREKCPCGRTSVRMDRIVGRTDDMMIVRGVNVFPSQIEAVLLSVGETSPHYQIVVDRRRDEMDGLEVLVEMRPRRPAIAWRSSNAVSILKCRAAWASPATSGWSVPARWRAARERRCGSSTNARPRRRDRSMSETAAAQIPASIPRDDRESRVISSGNPRRHVGTLRGLRDQPHGRTGEGQDRELRGRRAHPAGAVRSDRDHGRARERDVVVPIATLEGTLVASYSRGARVMNRSGGCEAVVIGDGFLRGAQFTTSSLTRSAALLLVLVSRGRDQATGRGHGSNIGVIDVLSTASARQFSVLFRARTGDAMGSNMASKAASVLSRRPRSCWSGRARGRSVPGG